MCFDAARAWPVARPFRSNSVSPDAATPKPPIAGIDGSVFNEAFCMTLASVLKLSVAPVQIMPAADTLVLLVQRYDRVTAAGATQPQRLH